MPISICIVPRNESKSGANGGLVAVVVYDGLSLFEYGCAVEVFGSPRPEMGSTWYRFATCSAEFATLRGPGGIQMQADGGLELLSKAKTIFIPGWRDIEAVVPPELCRALRKANKRGARIMSSGTGAFVLAAAGLLDGKRATTHWRHAATLAERYPEIPVEADVLYVDAGDVLTSAGSAAGIDLCRHLIRRDFGPRAANQVARRHVMPPHREGGQAQYIAEPVSKRSNASLATLGGRGARNIGRRLADCQDGKASRNECPHVPAALCQYDGYAAWRVVADRAFKPSEGVARRDRCIRG